MFLSRICSLRATIAWKTYDPSTTRLAVRVPSSRRVRRRCESGGDRRGRRRDGDTRRARGVARCEASSRTPSTRPASCDSAFSRPCVRTRARSSSSAMSSTSTVARMPRGTCRSPSARRPTASRGRFPLTRSSAWIVTTPRSSERSGMPASTIGRSWSGSRWRSASTGACAGSSTRRPAPPGASGGADSGAVLGYGATRRSPAPPSSPTSAETGSARGGRQTGRWRRSRTRATALQGSTAADAGRHR